MDPQKHLSLLQGYEQGLILSCVPTGNGSDLWRKIARVHDLVECGSWDITSARLAFTRLLEKRLAFAQMLQTQQKKDANTLPPKQQAEEDGDEDGEDDSSVSFENDPDTSQRNYRGRFLPCIVILDGFQPYHIQDWCRTVHLSLSDVRAADINVFFAYPGLLDFLIQKKIKLFRRNSKKQPVAEAVQRTANRRRAFLKSQETTSTLLQSRRV